MRTFLTQKDERVDEVDQLNDVSVVKRAFIPHLDQAFIYATWRNSRYYGCEDLKHKDTKKTFKDLTNQIKETLKTAQVHVACLEKAPDVIIGYVVFTGTHLDWVYVKDSFRKMGIASLLMPKTITSFTNQPTKIGRSILEKKNKENVNGDDAKHSAKE